MEVINCTSRASGKNIEFDDHEGCVECVLGSTLRKTGLWRYYNKNGVVNLTGSYVVLNYIGVPSVKEGIWTIFRVNGSLIQQIVYNKGEILEMSIFDDEGIKID